MVELSREQDAELWSTEEGQGGGSGDGVRGSGTACVVRRAVRSRACGRPTFRECRAKETEESGQRLEDKEKREESLSKRRRYSLCQKLAGS